MPACVWCLVFNGGYLRVGQWVTVPRNGVGCRYLDTTIEQRAAMRSASAWIGDHSGRTIHGLALPGMYV